MFRDAQFSLIKLMDAQENKKLHLRNDYIKVYVVRISLKKYCFS